MEKKVVYLATYSPGMWDVQISAIHAFSTYDACKEFVDEKNNSQELIGKYFVDIVVLD